MPDKSQNKTNRVQSILREQILTGQRAPGSRLPSHLELAATFEVSSVTMRNVLARLEEDGLLRREQGRGTFVRQNTAPIILVVDDNPETRAVLRSYVLQQGCMSVEAANVEEATAVLRRQPVTLVLADVRMPDKRDGIDFLRTLHRRWPEVLVAAMTGYLEDLAELHGLPEGPYMIISKPVQPDVVAAVLQLAIGRQRRDVARVSLSAAEPPMFGEMVRQALAYSRRYGQLLAVMIARVPGAGAAPNVLIRRLTEAVRESDTVGHVQGDEFGIVLPNVGSRDNALVAARKVLSQLTVLGTGPEYTDPSAIGLSLFPFDGQNAEILLSSAQQAVQRAEPGQVQVFEFSRVDAAS